MATLSIEQQIAALRPTMGLAANMHKWLMFGAVLGVIAAVVCWHPVPLMISVFLAIVAVAEQKAGPNIVAAITAYDQGTPAFGEAVVSITSGDSVDRYHAVVREPGRPDWGFEFVPQGWQPADRSYPAKIWRAGASDAPVLAVANEGIMIPRYDPKPVGTT